jgi:hypothetical protein
VTIAAHVRTLIEFGANERTNDRVRVSDRCFSFKDLLFLRARAFHVVDVTMAQKWGKSRRLVLVLVVAPVPPVVATSSTTLVVARQ